MADKVWVENETLPGRKVLLTKAQFRVYRQNGWVLTDPPPPPDPEDEVAIDRAAEAAAVSTADKKPAPKKSAQKPIQKKASAKSSSTRK